MTYPYSSERFILLLYYSYTSQLSYTFFCHHFAIFPKRSLVSISRLYFLRSATKCACNVSKVGLLTSEYLKSQGQSCAIFNAMQGTFSISVPKLRVYSLVKYLTHLTRALLTRSLRDISINSKGI